MSPDPQSGAHLKQLLILAMLAIVLAGCSLSGGRDVRAYNACAARHPHEAALCEGPRQAYEVDAATLQLGADSTSPRSIGSH
jgi:hypothetical protein